MTIISFDKFDFIRKTKLINFFEKIRSKFLINFKKKKSEKQ